MKKVLSLVAAAVLSLSILTGCGGSSYKDGNYKVAYDKADSKGWTAFVEVEVKDGKISNTVFDYKNAEGQFKSKDEAYNEKMKNVSGIGPDEFTVKYAEQLTKNQNLEKVDVVTGATSSKEDFEALAKEALKLAKDGKTTEATVAAPEKAK